jgi:tripeptide aminopeptidase
MKTGYTDWYEKPKESVIPKIKPIATHFKSVDVILLKKLFSLQTPSQDRLRQADFMNFILSWCRENKIKISTEYDAYGNLYITKGKAKLYPCTVSHIDTVHDYNKDLQIISTDYLILGLDSSTGEQHGIGADPKNGVYFVLEMLRTLDVMKAVLFMDEEVGCIGSKNSNIKFFKDCSFVVQLDRRSFTTDIIEYTNGTQVLSDEFKLAVFPICERYGYDFNRGTCTDVGELVWNGIGICAFNFSNGSFNEHRDYETCSIPHLLNAINAAYIIIKELGYQKQWKFNPHSSYELEDYRKPKSNYYDRYEDLWDQEPAVVYTPKTGDFELFILENILGKTSSMSNFQAAAKYVYDIGDEENIKWMYDYYVGKDVDECTLLTNVVSILDIKYYSHPQVKLLINKIKEYRSTLKGQTSDLTVL